ncbi:hypothetical protein [Halobacillus dabanensis]|uniref:hypothetical protein n=1 Tax=Halobacillus dabanensis TaxID=240302 RepID=UPI000943075D|nr:hypothetical protein [Halobacillus dabanensis]
MSTIKFVRAVFETNKEDTESAVPDEDTPLVSELEPTPAPTPDPELIFCRGEWEGKCHHQNLSGSQLKKEQKYN